MDRCCAILEGRCGIRGSLYLQHSPVIVLRMYAGTDLMCDLWWFQDSIKQPLEGRQRGAIHAALTQPAKYSLGKHVRRMQNPTGENSSEQPSQNSKGKKSTRKSGKRASSPRPGGVIACTCMQQVTRSWGVDTVPHHLRCGATCSSSNASVEHTQGTVCPVLLQYPLSL